MMDFNIQYGRSSEIFIDGQLNPNLIIEEGCWYLCIDTAELFIGVQTETGLTLKRINDAESHPTISEVKTKVEAVLLPKVEKVEEEIIPTVDDLKTWVENKEYLQDIDLNGYATETYVDSKVAELEIPDVSKFITEVPDEYVTEEELTAKGYLTEHQSLADYATKQDVVKAIDSIDIPKVNLSEYSKTTEMQAAISAAVSAKANKVLFTANQVVNNPIGGFVIGENVKDLTITELFTRLLGLTASTEPDTPEDPQGIISLIIANKLPMYQLIADGQLTALTYTDLITISAEEDSARPQLKPTESGFYRILDDMGGVTEYGYQQIQVKVPDVPFMLALPDIIDYQKHVSVEVYDELSQVWATTRLPMTKDTDEIADIFEIEGCEAPVIPNGYTLWVNTAEIYSSNAIYRFIITEEE